MTALIDLLPSDRDWLSELPEYQRLTLSRMPDEDDSLARAERWLEASGPSDTAPFGTLGNAGQIFLLNLLKEIRKLLCTEDGYASERAQLSKSLVSGQIGITSMVAVAVAPSLGASAIVVAPAVAVVLNLIANAARNTGCDTLAAAIERRESNKSPQ